MIPVPDPNHPDIAFLYACVAHNTTVLAELSPVPAAGDDLPHLAARCVAAAPRFHRHYSHTATGRIYAFLMADPLVFFAVADESLSKPNVLLFLHRLRDGLSSSSLLRRRSASSDPLPHLCFQNDFLPELRRLVRSVPSQDEESPPLLPCPPPPSCSPQPSDPDEDQIESKKKDRKGKSKKVFDRDIVDPEHGNGGSNSVQRAWRLQVLTIILIDLMACCLLIGVWLSVCRGFTCITS